MSHSIVRLLRLDLRLHHVECLRGPVHAILLHDIVPILLHLHDGGTVHLLRCGPTTTLLVGLAILLLLTLASLAASPS